MKFAVVEIVMSDKETLHDIRKWVLTAIRDGDGIFMEHGRLLVVLAGLVPGGAEAAAGRLAPELVRFDAKPVYVPEGQDPVIDSIYRRAGAKILPVEPR